MLLPTTWLHGGDEEFRGVKLVYAAGGVSHPPCPLLMEPWSDPKRAKNFEWLPSVHERAWRHLQDVGCYVFNNLRATGRMHLGVADEVFTMPDIMPLYWRKWIAEGAVDVPGKSELPIRRITDPVLIVCAIGYVVYGHWVLDILPRIWLFEKIFGPVPSGVRLILPNDTPKFGYDILEWRFGIKPSQIEHFDYKKEQLSLRVAYVPTLTHTDYAFHETFREFLDETVNKAVAQVGAIHKPKIYISRRQFSKLSISTPRHFVNELEIEEAVAGRGYEVVFPEELSWAEQISIFAGCKICVGAFGSGLHNTWFSGRDTVVIAFRWMNDTQSAIAGLRGQRNIFLLPEEEDENHHFRMDPSRVLQALDVAEEYARRKKTI